MRFPVLLFCCVFLAAGVCSAGPVFPSGYIPFTSLFIGPPAGNGDRVITGFMGGASYAQWLSLPLPAAPDEMFADAWVELAPGQFFSSVYVPTAAERSGDFSACLGCLLIDPFAPAGFYLPGNVIPRSRQPNVLFPDNPFGTMGVRIGNPIPEPATLPVTVLTLAGLWFGSRFRRRSQAS
jgi:hypothetical protein